MKYVLAAIVWGLVHSTMVCKSRMVSHLDRAPWSN